MALLNRLALTAALLYTFAATSFADEIGPGSPAPAIDVQTWVKGTPVKEFDKDKTYVVEFWATWCGPCLESIPHLTKLAKTNKDVTFVGVSVWEDNTDGGVNKFVKEMGTKMDYNVAYSSNQDKMAKTWMKAAAQNGIPTAFVVKNGEIQWIGHPMELEKPLAEIKANKFDRNAFKVSFDKGAAAARKDIAANDAFTNATDLFKAGKRPEARAALEKAVSDYPKMADGANRTKFQWLEKENHAAWVTKAKAMAASKDHAQIMHLALFALEGAQSGEDATSARLAMSMALKAAPKDFNVNLYAMNAYEKTKDYKLAIDSANILLKIFPTSPAKDNPEFKQSILKTKKEMQEKLKKG